MRKMKGRFFSILMAASLAFTPCMNAFAERSYDAGSVDSELIFPDDSVQNIWSSLYVDGEDHTPGEGGSWKNESSDVVYRASMNDEGISLTKIGYKLTVNNGVSQKVDPSEKDTHYVEEFPDPSIKTDIAGYAEYETVKLIADRPQDGMVFAMWTTDTEGVSFADPTSAETTLVMPGKKATVTATFQAAPVEEAVPEENQEINWDAQDQGTENQEINWDVQDQGTDNQEINWDVQDQGTDNQGTDNLEINWDVQDQGTDPQAQNTDEGINWDAVGTDNFDWDLGTSVSPKFVVTVNNGISEVVTDDVTYEEREFEPGTTVTIVAEDRTEEGLTFSGWTTESSDVVLQDASLESTEFVMPEGDIVVTASYVETPVISETEENLDQDQTEIIVEEPVNIETEPVIVIEDETELPVQTETQAETEVADTYELTVKNGIGSGVYEAGDEVFIEADDQDGMMFESWSCDQPDVQIENEYSSVTTFVMPAYDVSVSADFVKASYLVTLEDALFADDSSDDRVFEPGQKVEIKAKDRSDEGLAFEKWSGHIGGDESQPVEFEDETAEETSFIMPEGSVEIAAEYYQIPDTYYVSVTNGLINGIETEGWFEEGEVVSISADPNPYGQAFKNWTVNNGKYDLGEKAFESDIEVTVDQDLEFCAVYDGIQYAVTVNNGISSCSECVVGTTVNIKADNAPYGMVFDYWSVDTGNVTLADPNSKITSFTMPDDNVIVTANFRKVAYTLTVLNGYSSNDMYYAGDTVTISSYYPAANREFGAWYANTAKVSFKDASRWSTTFTMPDCDVTVKAAYKDGPSANDNLILNITPDGAYGVGETISFEAAGARMGNTNPNPGDYRYIPTGYQIGGVSKAWQSSPYTASMSIKTIGEYTLKTYYTRQRFDGNSWLNDGINDSKSVNFKVVNKVNGVATGDELPLWEMIALAGGSLVVLILVVVFFVIRRRRR